MGKVKLYIVLSIIVFIGLLILIGCSGERTITLSNDAIYTGEVKGGKPNGQGTWTHPDGYIYVGEFKDGMRHGQGTMTYADGTKDIGRWENEEYVGP